MQQSFNLLLPDNLNLAFPLKKIVFFLIFIFFHNCLSDFLIFFKKVSTVVVFGFNYCRQCLCVGQVSVGLCGMCVVQC